MPFRGIDIRESGSILFRTLLQDSSGAVVPSGNTQIRLYEFQQDGRLFQYDFSSLIFTSGLLTTPSGLMTQRKTEKPDDITGGLDTGIWTYVLPHSSGFKEGYIYAVRSTNTSASPPEQYREFQWSDGALSTAVKVEGQALRDVGSGVLSQLTSQFSVDGTIGGELQPVYYADIKQYYDLANNRDEFGVQWFKGTTPVTSGQLTNPAISVFQTATGASVFANKVMTYMSPTLGHVRYNSATSEVLPSGEPYLCLVSGTIGGSTRIWEKIVGRHNI